MKHRFILLLLLNATSLWPITDTLGLAEDHHVEHDLERANGNALQDYNIPPARLIIPVIPQRRICSLQRAANFTLLSAGITGLMFIIFLTVCKNLESCSLP